MKLPELGYTLIILEAEGRSDKNQGPKSLVLPRKRGNSRVSTAMEWSTRRFSTRGPVSSSGGSYAYKYLCIRSKRSESSFLGVGSDFLYVLG